MGGLEAGSLVLLESSTTKRTDEREALDAKDIRDEETDELEPILAGGG